MADELVYRLILDGAEENTSRPASPRPQPAPKPEASKEFEPVQLAQKRLQLEREALLVDQQARAIKEKKTLEQVQQDDAQREKDAKDPYAIARQLQARRDEAEAVRLALMANQKGSTIEAERLREEKERADEQARKAQQDAERQQAEAERERARVLREQEQTDPYLAARKSLEQERFAEQVRVIKEAAKAGMTPDDFRTREEQEKANKRAEEDRKDAMEQRRAFQQRVGSGVETAAGIAAQGARGNGLGTLGMVAGAINPIAGAVVSGISDTVNALRQHSEEVKRTVNDFAKFSPALTAARSENKMLDLLQQIRLATEYGAKYAERERQLGERNRTLRELKVGNDTSVELLVADLNIALERLKGGIYKALDWLTEPPEKVKQINRQLEEWAKRMRELQLQANPNNPLFHIPRFLFVREKAAGPGWDWAGFNRGRPARRQPMNINPGPFDAPLPGMKDQ